MQEQPSTPPRDDEPAWSPQPRADGPGGADPLPPLDLSMDRPEAPRKRFCGTCGAAWHPQWTACEACAAEIDGWGKPASISATAGSENPVGSALGLYFVLLASFGVLFFTDESNIAVAELVISALDTLLVLGWWVYTGIGRSWGPRLIGPPAAYPIAVIGGCATFLLASASIHILTQALGVPEISMSEAFLQEGYGWTVVFFAVCVQPAVVEEIAFRGIVLGALRRVMSDRDAIITSAMMFAILHLAVLSIPFLFVIGVAAAYLRIRTGSLLPCMLLHFVHNGLVIAQEAGLF